MTTGNQKKASGSNASEKKANSHYADANNACGNNPGAGIASEKTADAGSASAESAGRNNADAGSASAESACRNNADAGNSSAKSADRNNADAGSASAKSAGENKTSGIAEHKYLFHRGKNHRSYELLGAHIAGSRTQDGYIFRVWAPRARAVSVVGDFNGWDPGVSPMERIEDDDSIWELIIPEAREGDMYKFAVTSQDGTVKFKADPYAFYSERSGEGAENNQKASILYDISKKFEWTDKDYLEARDARNPYEAPMNIYEVHLGSWRRNKDGSVKTYRELAGSLIPYVKKMGYTHIELMPIMEHPFDGSWGYQITGYYSVTSRYGTPEDFKYFINKAHEEGIGVIFDWVPAHFPKDDYGLVEFDGQPLYEYTDPLKRDHKGWGTLSFDFGRPEVVSFLVSDAFFYCEEYHADGLRVDAVAAMLYLNYDRRDGEWTPNDEGGIENKEATKFLQTVNEHVLTQHPGVLMIAEESTAWPNVTKPPRIGGLGFNFKWNMGWMNDVLEYFSTDPLFRRGIHNKLTFAITYAYSENYILPISHDEVVHGKHSLLDKMPGAYEDKFAGMRCFLVYMMTHPGKKLLFMGQEFGHFAEWNEKKELDWMLLDYEMHRKMQKFVRELNEYYLTTPALWRHDDSFDGFDWIDADNADDNVYTYLRTDRGTDKDAVVIALNLSGKDFEEYDIGVPEAEAYTPVIDTDLVRAGGTGSRRKRTYRVKRGNVNGFDRHITVRLPRLSAIILEMR
ncbi:MAG: 1,4-alpha-glucan branching protein GlgB [Anaerovoracaceae bacterium]